MSISPMSPSSVPAGIDPNMEVRAANMAKNQQKVEGAQAISLIQSAGSPPAPTGSAGGNINIMV